MSGDILTLQFGTTSNFVGSHFWNLQEELRFQYTQLKEDEFPERDMKLLYRTSSAMKKSGMPLMCPRVVIYDYSSEYGYLSAKTSGISKDSIYHQRQKFNYLQTLAPTISSSSAASGIELFVQDPGRGPSQYHQHMSDLIFNPNEMIYQQARRRSSRSQEEEEEDGEGNQQERINEEISSFRSVQIHDKDLLEREKKTLIGGEEVPRSHKTVHEQFEKGEFSKYWSDFGKPSYHQKSLQYLNENIVHEYTGQVNLGATKWEELMDHSRFFLEECDKFDGIVNICDVHHLAFGTQYLQRLKDEMGRKTPIFSFFVSEKKIPEILSHTNESYRPLFPVDLMDYMSISSLVVPMNFQSVNDDTNFLLFSKNHYNPRLRYHPSSVLASSISMLLDPVTLYKKQYRMPMSRFLGLFPVLPIQKLALPSMSFPMPVRRNTDTLYSILDTLSPIENSDQMYSMSGFTNDFYRSSQDRKYLSHSVVAKGFGVLPTYDPITAGTESLTLEEKIIELFRREVLKKNTGTQNEKLRRKELDGCHTNKEMFSKFLAQTRTYSSYGYFSDSPFYVSDTFPQFFSDDVNSEGYLDRDKKREGNRVRVQTLPVLASLQNTSESGAFFKDNIMKVTNQNMKRIASFTNGEKALEDMMEYSDTMARYVDSFE